MIVSYPVKDDDNVEKSVTYTDPRKDDAWTENHEEQQDFYDNYDVESEYECFYNEKDVKQVVFTAIRDAYERKFTAIRISCYVFTGLFVVLTSITAYLGYRWYYDI